MVTIGTAGHIDHGKSSLVKALTDIDPDRLPEEKQRGMTIDLGFAWLRLASGETVGLVDVPGHKQFVHNVIPGLTGVDGVLLVVAGDDGWMPQTQEHLEIIDLLGISCGVVALNKIDLAPDADWVGLVENDIRSRLEATGLKGSPIIRTSTRTGQGIEELKLAIANMAAHIKARQDIGKPRLPVDRVFTIKGSGVVVTGTLSGGRLSVGDEVVISPSGAGGHIRGLESYKEKLQTVLPGARVAVNLAGLSREQVDRGDIVFTAGHVLLPSGLLDVKMTLLSSTKKPAKSNDEVSLFLGTRELLSRVVIIGDRHIAPGGQGFAQLRPAGHLSSFIGERFIIRSESPALTIGGGTVLDPHPARYHLKDAPATIARLQIRQSLKLEDIITTELSGGYALRAGFLEASSFSEKAVAAATEALEKAGRLVVTTDFIVTREYLDKRRHRLLAELEREHREAPLKPGVAQAELPGRLVMPKDLFGYVLGELSAAGLIRREGEMVALVGHRAGLTPEQAKLAGHIEAVLERSPSTPPSKAELLAELPAGKDLVHFMLRQGHLVELPDGILLSGERFARLRKQIIDLLTQKGSISIQDVAALTGFSRKYSIPLLTRLDSDGVTRREGNVRVPATKPG